MHNGIDEIDKQPKSCQQRKIFQHALSPIFYALSQVMGKNIKAASKEQDKCQKNIKNW